MPIQGKKEENLLSPAYQEQQDIIQSVLENRKSILDGKTFAELGENDKQAYCSVNKVIMEAYWNCFERAKETGHFEEAAINFIQALEMGCEKAYDLFLKKMSSYNTVETSATFSENRTENFYMGIRYCLGLGLPQHDNMAIKFITDAADKGLSVAQYLLGYCYDAGAGVEKNKKEAVKWYLLATEQGHAIAQNNLGHCYRMGEGVNKDTQEAFKWYRLAAEHGYNVAQFNLGYCYKYGTGVDKDEKEAFKWYRLAAEQRLAVAQNSFGHCYKQGIGVDKDPKEAVKWYRLAAEQGYAIAQNNLGHCYQYGVGVDKDPEEAVKWYRLATEQGCHVAQNNLGHCYHHGEGVEKDEKEAVKWYRLAAEQGNASGLLNLKKLHSPLAHYTVSLLENNHENLIELALNDKNLRDVFFKKDIFYTTRQLKDKDRIIIFLQTLVERIKNLPEDNKNALFINTLISIDKALSLLPLDCDESLAQLMMNLLEEVELANTEKEHIISLMYFLCNINEKDSEKNTLDALHRLWHRSQSFNNFPMTDSCLNRLIAAKIVSHLFKGRFTLAFTADFSADDLETLFNVYHKKSPLSVKEVNKRLSKPLLIESKYHPQKLLPELKACLANDNNFESTRPHYIEKLTGLLQNTTASNEEEWQSVFDTLAQYANGINLKQNNPSLFKSPKTLCKKEKELLRALGTKNVEELQDWIALNTCDDHCIAASSSSSSTLC